MLSFDDWRIEQRLAENSKEIADKWANVVPGTAPADSPKAMPSAKDIIAQRKAAAQAASQPAPKPAMPKKPNAPAPKAPTATPQPQPQPPVEPPIPVAGRDPWVALAQPKDDKELWWAMDNLLDQGIKARAIFDKLQEINPDANRILARVLVSKGQDKDAAKVMHKYSWMRRFFS